jgi:hypothetical protein
MVELKLKNKERTFMSSKQFYDRLFFLIKEENESILYSEFVSKVHIHGAVKVLKTLGLYKTFGKGTKKITFVHPRIEFLLYSTIPDFETSGKKIMELLSGVYYGLNRFEVNFSKYKKMPFKDDETKLKYNGGSRTYLIKNKSDNLTKIGASGAVHKRLKSLSRKLGNDLMLVAYCNVNIERLLHKEFKHKQVLGEWFNLSDKETSELIEKYDFETLNQ